MKEKRTEGLDKKNDCQLTEEDLFDFRYLSGKAVFILLFSIVLLTLLCCLLQSGKRGEEMTCAVSASGDHHAGKRLLPIYCVDTDEPKVALSFDAAWGNEDTEILLALLEKHGIRATFFMTGGWIEAYPEDVKKIAEAGHDLGNHSEHHYDASKLTKDQMLEELMLPHEKVKKLTGTEMTLFRPPSGDYNDALIETAVLNHYYPVQWDVDSLDWKNYGVDSIVEKVLNHKHLGNGSIILMHNGAKYTKDALEAVIVGLKEKGYEIVPISELIYQEEYGIDHEGRQFSTKSTE